MRKAQLAAFGPDRPIHYPHRTVGLPPSLDQRDGPRDECGVFGVYAPEHDVARLTYFALYALQHRGQESAGIAAADHGGYIITQRALGLVNAGLQGARPARARRRPGDRPRALLDDGLQRVGELPARAPLRRRRRQPPRARAGPQRQPDQRRRAARRAARARRDVLARPRTRRSSPRCWPRTRPTTIEDAIADVMPRLQGAFSTVVMTKERVYAFRDPAGVRPLSLGLLGDRYCVAQRVVRVRHHRRQAPARRRARRARLARRRRHPHPAGRHRRARGVLPLRAHLLRAARLAHGRRRPAGLPRADGRDPRPRGAGAGRRPRHRGARLGQRRRARLRPRRRACRTTTA